ncbi:MAG: enoyl-CoA hydratase/isomerase family protein [Burkholderiales bacterium]|nr:enoyl-CoA hydratase/isomerase family protein [Burkholderiales bacterium]
MTEPRLLVDKRPPVAVVTLNEPDKRNPFSPALVRQMTEALREIERDDDIVVVIFTGAGSAFSGGADLREMRKASALEDRGEYEHILELNRLVWNFPKVTISAINGPALGLGANLVGWSDLAIAEERATIGYPEVRAGIASATVIPALLRLIGRKAMNEMLFTGRPVDAAEAHRLGLVNRVVPNGESLQTATALALEIAGNAHHGIAFTKEVVRTATDMEYNKALEYARDIRVISRLHPKFQARIDSYLARRAAAEKKR